MWKEGHFDKHKERQGTLPLTEQSIYSTQLISVKFRVSQLPSPMPVPHARIVTRSTFLLAHSRPLRLSATGWFPVSNEFYISPKHETHTSRSHLEIRLILSDLSTTTNNLISSFLHFVLETSRSFHQTLFSSLFTPFVHAFPTICFLSLSHSSYVRHRRAASLTCRKPACKFWQPAPFSPSFHQMARRLTKRYIRD